MPRTSKRKRLEPVAGRREETKKLYKVGIYARLSSDRDEKKNESVEVQIEIAKNHIESLIRNGERMELYDVYSDLGKTGSNFHRNEFSRMMQDVRLSEVNCIIVKDLSRFGRNYLEAGNYIEKIFPFLEVRFIAVTDGFDTAIKGSDNRKLAMNIKNLVNDMYAKDFSKKAKLHLQQCRERGSYVGGVTPYGYTYEWVDKNKKLVKDNNTKTIIELMFKTFLCERNYSAVARLLNERRVNPPAIYKETNEVICPEGKEYKGWEIGSLARMLTNETYVGRLIQGKTSITGRNEENRVKKEESEWTVVEDCHEPLIDKEIFDKAKSIVEEIKKKSIGKKKNGGFLPLDENIFENVLYCGLCGKKMTRISFKKEYINGDKRRLEYYECSNAYKTKMGHPCESNRIRKEKLSDILLSSLRLEFAVYLKKPKLYIERNKAFGEQKEAEYQNDIRSLEREIERMEEDESCLYMKYRANKIQMEQYMELKRKNEDKKEELLRSKRKQEECIQSLSRLVKRQSNIIRSLIKLNSMDGFSKELLDTLVEKIYVYPGKRVEITYSFSNQEMGGIL